MPRQSARELQEHLEQQIQFMRTSADRYDEGHRGEAARLAVALRILAFHNPKSGTHALLDQVGLMQSILFYDSAGEIDDIVSVGTTLASVTLDVPGDSITFHIGRNGVPEVRDLSDAGAVWEPHLCVRPTEGPDPLRMQIPFVVKHGRPRRKSGQWVGFDQWWVTNVLRTEDGEMYNRSDLVRLLANKDGGSHVDPKLSERYSRLTRSNSIGFMIGRGVSEGSPGNPVPAAVRQIAWEVERTLQERRPVHS